jgi:hypothetical protein
MIAGLTAAVTLLQGCALESEQFSEISPDLYPKTQRDAEDLLTGNVYAPFRMDGYDGVFNRANGMQILSDVGSDYGLCAWGFPGGSWGPLEFGQVTPSTQYGATMNYDKGYPKFFGKMIQTIERLKVMDLADDVKNRYIAEAQCGLAFLGYMLYDFHGPMVVPDAETLQNPEDAVILPRLTDAAMIAFIEDNAKAAATVLPDTYAYNSDDYGRFTKGLCHALLLKLYMLTGRWADAVAQGQELKNAKYGYGLVTETGASEFASQSAYAHLFSVEGEGNKETVWAVNCAPADGVQYEWFPNALTNGKNGATGWGGFKLPRAIYNAYNAADTRLQTMIENPTNELGPDPVKYEINVVSGSDTRSSLDWMIFRYADVLTLYAEAVVRNGGDYTGEPLAILNQIRTRAGLATLTTATLTTKDAFLYELLDERGREFYWEGVRRSDLIRYGRFSENGQYTTFKQVMTAKCTAYGQPAPASDYNWRWFPLPQSVIVEGQGIIKQNPPFGDYSGE